jgi:antitoxin PrlF
VEAAAKLTSKGQITIPKAVREALGVREGDWVIFRIEGSTATVASTRRFLELAGSVPVPEELKGVPWEEIRRRAWEQSHRP